MDSSLAITAPMIEFPGTPDAHSTARLDPPTAEGWFNAAEAIPYP